MGKNYKFQGVGLTVSEKKWGKKQFSRYQDNYHIDTFSDLQLLEELVFREALQERYKRTCNKLLKKEEARAKKEALKEGTEIIITESAPKHILNSMNDNLNQAMILREKLGFFEEKKNDDNYTIIQRLKKKFKKWLEENQGSRTLICPHPQCGKLIMLKIRIEAWEALKHPFFKDKILANEHLWKLFKEGKIDEWDVAKVLQGVNVRSTDYVKWLAKRIYKDLI